MGTLGSHAATGSPSSPTSWDSVMGLWALGSKPLIPGRIPLLRGFQSTDSCGSLHRRISKDLDVQGLLVCLSDPGSYTSQCIVRAVPEVAVRRPPPAIPRIRPWSAGPDANQGVNDRDTRLDGKGRTSRSYRNGLAGDEPQPVGHHHSAKPQTFVDCETGRLPKRWIDAAR